MIAGEIRVDKVALKQAIQLSSPAHHCFTPPHL
jgi:hypothetical protein